MSDCVDADDAIINKSESVKMGDQEGSFVVGKVMEEIFSKCDADGSGTVLVSELVDYIKPYLHENLDALVDLKRTLDPNNSNPCVDRDTFFTAMSDWTNKLSCKEQENSKNESRNCNENNFCERTTFAHNILTNCAESAMTLSCASSNNGTEINAVVGFERSCLEERINELEYQKKKVTDELERVNQELVNMADCNEKLQSKFEKLKKKLANEQRANEQLQENQTKEWGLEETLNASQNQNAKLTKTVSDLEKANDLLKRQLDDIGVEKEKLEEKTIQMNKSYEEVITAVAKLEAEISVKEQEVSSLKERNYSLNESLTENQKLIDQCNLNNERLRVEKSTVEKLLCDRVEKNNSLLNLGNTKASRSCSIDQVTSPSISISQPTSPNISIGSIESCDDDMYYKIQAIAIDQRSHESLHAEMSQVVIKQNIVEHQCDHSIKLIEAEHKILSLQCELIHHQNCTFIIERHKQEIEDLKRENTEYCNNLQDALTGLADLKTQYSLSKEKETLLQNKLISLEATFKESKTYVNEVNMRLDACKEIEDRCKLFEEKIDALESENSLKYVQMVELTMEIDKLRQQTSLKEENEKIKFLQIENEMESLIAEKDEMLVKLSHMERANKRLLNNSDNFESNLLKLEEEIKDLLSDKRGLEFDKFTLQSQNENLKIQLETLEMDLENVESAKRNLHFQIEELESEKEIYEHKIKELNSQLCKIESEILEERKIGTELKDQNEDLKQQKGKLTSDSKELRNEKDNLCKQLEDQFTFKMDLENKLQRLQSDFEIAENNFQFSLEQHGVNYEEIKKENNKLIIENDTNIEMISSLESKLDEVSKESDDWKNRLNTLKIKVEEYRKEKLESDELKHSLIKENKQLHSNIEKNKMTIKKKDIENKKMSLEIVDLKLSCDKLTDNTALMEKRIRNLVDEKGKLKKTISEKDEILKSLNDRIEEMNQEITINGSMVKDYSITNGTLEEELENKNEELSRYKSMIDKNENVVSNLKDSIENYLQDLKITKKINNDLEKSMSDFNDVKSKLDLEKNENEGLREVIKHMEIDMQKLEDKYNLELKQKDGLEDELHNAKSDSKKTKEHYNNALNERTNLLNDLKNQSEHLKKIQNDNEKLLYENSDLKLTIETLNIKIVNFAEENKVINEEMLRLSLENNQLESDKIKKLEMIEVANLALVNVQSNMQELKEKVGISEKTTRKFYEDELKMYRNEKEKLKIEIEKLQKEKELALSHIKLLEEQNEEYVHKIEEFLIDKEYLLTQKLEMSKKQIENDYSKNCMVLESKMPRKVKLNAKNRKLEEKIGILEEQLSNEKKHTYDLTQENRTNLDEIKKLKENLKETEAMKEELNCKLSESQENCLKLINDYSLVDIDIKGTENDEISQLKMKLEDEKNETTGHINTIKRTLCESRFRLENATLNAMNSWKSTLNTFSNLDVFFNSLEVGPVSKPYGALYEEMFKLKHQVRVTVVLLDNFTAIKKKVKQSKDVQIQTSCEESVNSSGQRSSKKFSLKPATLVFQPVNDDSFDIRRKNNEGTNAGDNIFKSSVGNLTTGENFPIIDYNNRAGNLEDKLAQDANQPNVNVVEDLGLCADDVSMNNLSEREVEEKFTALVLAFTIDNASVTERYNKQSVQLAIREEAFAEEISTLSTLLEEYLSLEQQSNVSVKLENVLRICMQISMSAARCGALTLENQQAKSIGLMINYVEILRKKLKTLNEYRSTTVQLYQKTNDKTFLIKEDKEITFGDGKKLVQNSSKVKLHEKKSFYRFLRVIFWSLFLILCTVLLQYMYDGGFGPIIIQWDWKSWEYYSSSILKKEYRNGPPPI